MKKVVLAVALVGFVFFSYTPVEAAPQAQCQQCRCQHSKFTNEQFRALANAAYKAGKNLRPTFSSEYEKQLKRALMIAETIEVEFRTFFWEGFNSQN